MSSEMPAESTRERRELRFEEFRGGTVEEAERLARQSLGEQILGIEIVRDVQSLAATAQGGTAQTAIDAADRRLPSEAVERQPAKVVQEGQSGTVDVQEWDEREARKAGRRAAPRGAEIDSIVCTSPPRSGVLGLGKRPGTWEVRWSAPFIAEAAYKMPAVVKARYFG